MIVLDSGVLIAAADADDQHHAVCAALFDEPPGKLIVPAGVVVEVCWILARHVSTDAEAQFLRSLAVSDPAVEPLTVADYARAGDLVSTYRNLPLGAVDAMVVAVAERLGARTIATIDRRDFTIIRPRHIDPFDLVPELPKRR